MEIVDVLVLTDLTIGRRVLLARTAKGWRQTDLAAYAKVPTAAVTNLEKDRSIRRWKLYRILEALDLARPS